MFQCIVILNNVEYEHEESTLKMLVSVEMSTKIKLLRSYPCNFTFILFCLIFMFNEGFLGTITSRFRKDFLQLVCFIDFPLDISCHP